MNETQINQINDTTAIDVVIPEFKIEASLPNITSNFEELKLAVEQRLKKYDISVTTENLPDAKKLSKELSGYVKTIEEVRKAEVKRIQTPVDALNEKVKILTNLFKEGKTKIDAQVEVFENETRAKCLNLLKQELFAKYTEKGIDAEFQIIKVEDLAILTNLTEKGALTGKAKTEIEARVMKAFVMQSNVQRRLLELKIASLEAGLKAPLERMHIESFLKEENEQIYSDKLKSFFNTELTRQRQIEDAMNKANATKQQLAPTIQVETPTQAVPPVAPVVKTSETVKSKEIKGFDVLVKFQINDPNANADDLKAKFETALSKFPGFESVEISTF